MDLEKTALLIVDLQNDFLHPEGAYGRAGQTADAITALPARVKPVIDALRAKGGTYVSAQFTLVPGPGGEPLIAPHLKKLRPFLGKGDFAPGAKLVVLGGPAMLIGLGGGRAALAAVQSADLRLLAAAAELVADAVSARGMVGGQMEDLEATGQVDGAAAGVLRDPAAGLPGVSVVEETSPAQVCRLPDAQATGSGSFLF